MQSSILIIEDADSLRESLKLLLAGNGYEVTAVNSAELGLRAVREGSFSCILTDFKLPGMNGLEFVEALRNVSKSVPCIVMTAYGSIEIAVEAMKRGANDFIAKPFEPSALLQILKDVIEHRRALDRTGGLLTRRARKLLTASSSMERVLKQAQKVARVDSSVLILGESGTGKELVARYIHEQSPRRDKNFVAVNCAAIPPALLESEFFGHDAGAFTGATQSRKGVFEVASEGTIFLDEVGDMPLALQVKLLRALQEREIRPVGSNRHVHVNPRILAATNRDVNELMESGALREDFFYRIAVVSLTLPPLRERPEDVAHLARYFVESFSRREGKDGVKITDEAMQALSQHHWPGNARELENVIERAVVLAGHGDITPLHLGLSLEPAISAIYGAACNLVEISSRAAREAEISVIRKILARTAGNKTRAAEMLGVSYKTLLNKVKEYEIEPHSAAQ